MSITEQGMHKTYTQSLLEYALEPMGLDKGYVVIRCITNHTYILCDRGFPSC